MGGEELERKVDREMVGMRTIPPNGVVGDGGGSRSHLSERVAPVESR